MYSICNNNQHQVNTVKPINELKCISTGLGGFNNETHGKVGNQNRLL